MMAAGCRSKPTTPPAGAKEKAFEFFEAIRLRNWSSAFATVDRTTRPDLTADTFDALTERYRKSIGFEPEQVNVTACDEHGESATAHIVFIGHSAMHQRFKDGITLRRDNSGWLVILPNNFGR